MSAEGETDTKGQLKVSAMWSLFPYYIYKVMETQIMDKFAQQHTITKSYSQNEVHVDPNLQNYHKTQI